MPLVFLTYALFGSVFTVGKVTVYLLPPLFLTGFRYLLAGFFMLACILLSNGFVSLKKHLILILKVAFFNVFLTNSLEFWALQNMNSSKTALFYSLSPFYSMIFAYYYLNEKMTQKKLLGLFIGFLGFLALIFTSKNLSNDNLTTSFSWPEMAANGAAIFSVFGWIYFKKLVYHDKFPAWHANAYSFIIGGIISLLFSFFLEDHVSSMSLIEMSPQIGYITLVHSIVCFSLYGLLLKKFTVTFLFFAGLLNPLFAAIYGFFFLGELIELNFIICLLAIALGLYLFFLEERNSETFAT